MHGEGSQWPRMHECYTACIRSRRGVIQLHRPQAQVSREQGVCPNDAFVVPVLIPDVSG